MPSTFQLTWGKPRMATRISMTVTLTLVIAIVLRPVQAQAPVNDIVSWPSGVLLLASVLYAALGTVPERLWEMDPSIGWFLWSGLPKISIPTMQRVNWVSKACHFVPGIRTAYGKSNFWIRAEEVSDLARAEALRKTLAVVHPVVHGPSEDPIDDTLWRVTSIGLVTPAPIVPLSPSIKPVTHQSPSARDFLLFAAADYHVFRNWEVRIMSHNIVVFSTKSMPASSIVDVDTEEVALYVVAAHMVRRPHSQSPIRALAQHHGDEELDPWTLSLDNVDMEAPACSIDFHSYSPEASKASASLRELAGAYYRVVQYIRRSTGTPEWPITGELATISVGQTLWISFLGGALLDHGRLTIQNLPGRRGMRNVSADEGYLNRIEAVLQAIEPYANKPEFFDLVFSGGSNRRASYPFLIAGLVGQVIICYFLSVGTSAGVWTSVALANSLYVGRLTDLHSVFNGKTADTEEPGLKMYLPGSPSKELMVIATFNRSTPRQGTLRPGVLLNAFGLVAAVFGAIFQSQTRTALDFSSFTATPDWVVYTSAALAVGTSLLILTTIVLQQTSEQTWNDGSEMPTRWMIYSTLPVSCVMSGLAVFFMRCKITRFWPVLDALTFLSGVPLGMLENGRIFAADANMLHLVLLNRWIMGAVASSVGSNEGNTLGVCF
ncbi:uncharacterized protein STEHIDRAFT_118797 [Stereum hirsutum FP-91666 SS1]|uniref:uncharacterized protein n=1 Tax=Stereum hirsutum (strain FP-91666) TaxID=721885 RepID=UPI000440DE18|nr:uncharacterized protein STEHIDRAFT_118797 [Stereum hirsutum FP-91666 SS1]EIM89647.1 hypothetical protein STEHIDRAFT_118797 [Stereum hirsutum FP-91666 SS1]